jgi:hypothetical protein
MFVVNLAQLAAAVHQDKSSQKAHSCKEKMHEKELTQSMCWLMVKLVSNGNGYSPHACASLTTTACTLEF